MKEQKQTAKAQRHKELPQRETFLVVYFAFPLRLCAFAVEVFR